MDQEGPESSGMGENMNGGSQGTSQNSSDLNGNSDKRVVVNPGETDGGRGEDGTPSVYVSGLTSREKDVNQETVDGNGIVAFFNEGTSGNSGSLVKEFVLEKVVVINSDKAVSISGEHKDLGASADECGSSDRVESHKTHGEGGNYEALDPGARGTSGNLGNHVDGFVLETVIVINSEENAQIRGENGGLEVNSNELASTKVITDKSTRKASKGEKQSCVVDVKCGGGIRGGGSLKDSIDGERVCRICHLSSDAPLEDSDETATAAATTSMDLIQLGCGCKDELGIAHAHCAEAWFKLKGNRICEICGETAKNVTGVGDNRFMEEWNERRFISNSNFSSERGGGCWRGQPFCNFLMACLVIAFVLPWFFRVNMF